VSVVEVEHVRKFYDKVPALDDVSLTFGEGEFFGLLGPSGSGKTTLLRSIAGFVEPDSGDIRIDGRQVGDTPVHRREIGMVFQNYALFPHMTVFDNVGFGLSVRGLAGGEIKSRVLAMLDLVRLSGLEQRRPRQLSGGQQQRVALARAVVTRPRVLLLDEPLGALDKRLRQQMQIELKQIQREIGITTVFVTHDQEEALTLSDRIAIFNEGRVVQVGAPHAVYERPQTVFAAHFLGDANFFRGRSAGSQQDLGRIELEGGGVVYTRDPLPARGAEVTIAVRPEKLLVRSAQDAIPESHAENLLTGSVLQAVYSGNSITYRVRCGATEMTVFEQNRAARPWEAGTTVQLAWDPMHSVVVQP
jgi:spermidine/putrescine ABC transporter ATP-binding subunit